MAASQVALATRLEYAGDYSLTVSVAVARGAVPRVARTGGRDRTHGLGPQLAGAAIAIASVVVMASVPGYRSFFRFLPLLAGAGLAVAASGARAWTHHRGSLLLLALPLLNPPAKLLHAVVDPVLVPVTTWCALGLNRVVGHPMTADGSVLRMPHSSLQIVDGCSGLWAITRLCVLAALVIALFPTTARQRVELLASAVLIALALNAVRVAVLATTMLHLDDTGFAYWHQGSGATVFAIASSAVAGLAWWLLLRRGRGRQRAP